MGGRKIYTGIFLLATFPSLILTSTPKTFAYGEGPYSAVDYNGIEGPGEYVLIYPQVLASAAQGLVAWRSQNDNLVVAFVKVEDIYADPRFEAGTPDQEIKNFLIYAYENWSISPEFCCLYGSWNFIPAHICDFAGAENRHWQSWYGCVAGDDDIPEISVGRVWAAAPLPENAINVV